jgi:hypothetical protein
LDSSGTRRRETRCRAIGFNRRFTEHSWWFAFGSFARLLRTTLDQEDRAQNLSVFIMFGTTVSNRWNWQKLCSYGEVVCFVSAWAVGILIAMQAQQPNNENSTARNFATVSDTLGIQAKLR